MAHKDIRRSWFVLFGAWVLMFLETGIVKSLGVLLPDLREQFATKTWVIGLAISLTPGFGSIVCVLSGVVSKVLSPRVTIIACAVLFFIGVFATAFATNVYVISLTLLLTGVNTGTATVSSGALSQYFDKYYNLAVSINTTGMSLGMAVMPLVTQFLLDIYGWRGAVLLLSAIIAHGIVCGAIFKPISNQEYEPFFLTGDANLENSSILKMFMIHLKNKLDLNLLKESSFLAYVVLFRGSGFYTTGWLIYVVPHVIEIGFSPYQTSVVAAVGGFTNVVGNVSYILIDKIVPRTAQLYLYVCMITASFAFDVVASDCVSYIGFITCSVVFGFGRGLLSTSSYTKINDALDEDQMINAVGWMGATYGMTSFLSGFACGWLYDQTGSYNMSFLLLAAACLGTAIPICIKNTRSRFK